MKHPLESKVNIMPKIIYKQQHVGDNGRKFSASRNAHYVKYIGEREHVLKPSHETNLVKYMGEREHAAKRINKMVKEIENDKLVTHDVQSHGKAEYDVNITKASEEMFTEPENGLFGVINGKYSDNYSTAEMQKYVRKISTPHRNVFHSVFSFTPDSAEEAGLRTLDEWESWVKYHISDIANGMNMKIENIEYLAAVHLKEGQPHVHIMWWDKSQQVLINKVDPLVCDKIRIDVMRSTYRSLFTEIYNKEEIMRRSLRKQIGEYTLQHVINGADDNYAANIAAGIYRVYRVLPPKGQFKYKFMKLEKAAKQELDNLTHYIIDNNPEFKAQYDEICELRLMYNQLLHSEESRYGNLKITKYMDQVNDKIENAVGNEILRIIKVEKNAGHFDKRNYPDFEPPEDNHDNWQEAHEENGVPHGDAPPNSFIRWSAKFKAARKAADNGDIPKALDLYSQEAAKGNILAKYEIADLRRKKLCEGSETEFFREALNGFLEIEPTTRLKPYVQYRIGRMYYDGYGTERNLKEAFDWLKKSADGGNHLSEYMIGKMCLFDKDHRDLDTAQKYLTAAADSGNQYAQQLLDNQTAWTQTQVVKLMGSIGRLLSQNVESSRAALHECSAAVFGRGDLSKEQIRELLLKMQDKENTAEM